MNNMGRAITLDLQGNDITSMKNFDVLMYPCEECDRIDCVERKCYRGEK